MPSITGGSSTDRGYAPHMYVLQENGDSSRDDNYDFVGNATVYYTDNTINTRYHIGVNVLGEVVGDKRDAFTFPPTDSPFHAGIPNTEIPEQAKQKLVEHGVRQISNVAGNQILTACGIELPADLEPVSFEKIFNGSKQEKQAQQELRERWEAFGQEITSSFE